MRHARRAGRRPREAYGHIERSLRLVDELGIHHAVTAQARLLVQLAERCGEDRLAAQWRSFVEGRGAGWTHYDASVMASAHNQDGLRARAEGDLDRAVTAHRAALEWYLTANIAAGIVFSESSLGFMATARGDEASAVCHHAAALVAAAASEDPNALALALEGAPPLRRTPVTAPGRPNSWAPPGFAGRRRPSRSPPTAATSTTSSREHGARWAKCCSRQLAAAGHASIGARRSSSPAAWRTDGAEHDATDTSCLIGSVPATRGRQDFV